MARRRGKVTGTAQTGLTLKTPKPSMNPYVSPITPIDPAAENAKVVANRNVALSDAAGLNQLGQIENVYGLGRDTSNPYSKGKLLENNYFRSQRGNLNAYGSADRLHGGAYRLAEAENQRDYLMGYDQLARDYTGVKQQVGLNTLQTYANAGTGVDQAIFDAALRALFPSK